MSAVAGQSSGPTPAGTDGQSGAGSGFMSAYRQWLGLIVIAIGLLLLLIVSGLAIGFASSGTREEATRLVFAAVVPLVGTWVGTVLAFYFSRDNFEAAATQTRATYAQVAGLTASTPVIEAMLPASQIAAPAPVADDTAAKALALKDLMAFLSQRNVSRAPIFNSAGAVLYVVHDFVVYRYAASAGVTPPDFGGKTIADLLLDTASAGPATAFDAVGPSASVGDARAKLTAKADCRDVFVTENGGRDGRVLGWLTNNDLARLS